PERPYQLMEVKVCTVMKNSHICLSEDKHYYSVPHQYMGKKAKVLFNDERVEIYYRYHPIARHKRDKRKHKYTTLGEHLAGNHQADHSESTTRDTEKAKESRKKKRRRRKHETNRTKQTPTRTPRKESARDPTNERREHAE